MKIFGRQMDYTGKSVFMDQFLNALYFLSLSPTGKKLINTLLGRKNIIIKYGEICHIHRKQNKSRSKTASYNPLFNYWEQSVRAHENY